HPRHPAPRLCYPGNSCSSFTSEVNEKPHYWFHNRNNMLTRELVSTAQPDKRPKKYNFNHLPRNLEPWFGLLDSVDSSHEAGLTGDLLAQLAVGERLELGLFDFSEHLRGV